jgi:serine/threonine protein kinase
LSSHAQGGVDLFSSLLDELIAERGEEDLTVSSDPSGVWLHVEPRDVQIPSLGWKLHVSAIPSSAHDVLRRAFQVLAPERVAFKVAAQERNLYELNQGAGGRSQVGKFITVYPRDDDHAVRLAVALDEATSGLRGPHVPSDRALSPTSLVHYRYGGFVMDEADLAARNPKPPETDPFHEAGVFTPSEQRLIAARYLITSTLHRSVRGAIHLAVEVTGARTCILKRAWRDACAMPDGRDARDRLREEADLMKRLGPDVHLPEMWDVVEHEQDLFLVMEYVSGPTLAARVHENDSGGRALSPDEVVHIGRELSEGLQKIHEAGYVHRDLSPANAILRENGHVALVDFELALPIGARNEEFAAGTPGYMSPEQAAAAPASIADDVYGLGALLHLVATGSDPEPGKLALSEVPPNLAEVIARAVERDPSVRWDSMSSLRNALDQ